MKDLQAAFVVAVCLLAFAVIVFFFKYGSERAQTKALEAENLATQSTAMDAKLAAEKRIQDARAQGLLAERAAQANAQKAKEAREMLERATISGELTQKEIIDSMNAQLEREADARLAAQKASEELAQQRAALASAVDETQSAMDELKRKSAAEKSDEVSKMQSLLAEREAEIAALKKRQDELELIKKDSAAAQIVIEREIVQRGGNVTLPRYKRIISPDT